MSEKSYQLRTLSRALDVLAMIETSSQPLTMTAIADRLEEAGPVIFRILKTLEAKGYIRRDGDSKRYLPSEAHDRLGTARLLVQVMQSLSGSSPQTVEELAAEGDRGKSSVELVLGIMKDAGLAIVSQQGEWSLSPHLPELSRSQSTGQLLERVRPVMHKLFEATGETVALFVRSGNLQVALDVMASRQPLRYAVEMGSVFPVTRGAAGKACMAWLGEEEINWILEDKALANERVNRSRLLQELADTRARGFAISFGERIVGAAAAAVPVLGSDGSVSAVIAVTGPASRCPKPRLAQFGEQVRSELTKVGVKVPETKPYPDALWSSIAGSKS